MDVNETRQLFLTTTTANNNKFTRRADTSIQEGTENLFDQHNRKKDGGASGFSVVRVEWVRCLFARAS